MSVQKKEPLPDFLILHNLHTRLLEVCEWDEELASSLIKKSIDTYVDLYEYSKYDSELIKTEEDFKRLFEANVSVSITDEQAEALKDLLDARLKEMFSG